MTEADVKERGRAKIYIFESDCVSGEPVGPRTGRAVVMDPETVRAFFTPEEVATQIIAARASTIPRNVYEVLMAEMERRDMVLVTIGGGSRDVAV